MRKIEKIMKMTMFLMFIISCICATAQEVIPAAGGEAGGSGGSVSYSLGQVVYQTHTAVNGSVAEGVQQPYEISVVIAIKETEGISLLLSAFPNPTTDKLTLEIHDFEISGVFYQLYDINGKLLQNEKITDLQTTISMSNLVRAIYFLKIIQGNTSLKVFKIIKH